MLEPCDWALGMATSNRELGSQPMQLVGKLRRFVEEKERKEPRIRGMEEK